MRFRVIRGIHREGGRSYKKGDILESNIDLCKLFSGRFLSLSPKPAKPKVSVARAIKEEPSEEVVPSEEAEAEAEEDVEAEAEEDVAEKEEDVQDSAETRDEEQPESPPSKKKKTSTAKKKTKTTRRIRRQ